MITQKTFYKKAIKFKLYSKENVRIFTVLIPFFMRYFSR